MTELNLVANDAAQKRVLEYLQENASETLAEKINKGVHVTVDGKELINVKDLSGFMRFAVDEARKLCEKGATSACVEDDKVFGWAIHYFEEDSIQGKLFTLDGMEYKKERPKTIPKTTITKTTVTAKPEPKDRQISIFDFTDLDSSKQDDEQNETEQEDTVTEQIDDVVTEQDEDEEQDDIEELELAKEQVQQVADNYAKTAPFYKKYCELKGEFIDSILFFRLGDFYELFDDDAVTAAKILDLTLTGKNVGLPNKVPLAGVPYHAIETYVKKLSKNHNVVVYDDDNEKYLVMNGRHIDLVTGVVTNLGEVTNATTEETNPHIRYLQTLIDDLKVDL